MQKNPERYGDTKLQILNNIAQCTISLLNSGELLQILRLVL